MEDQKRIADVADTPTTSVEEVSMFQVVHATQIKNPWVCKDDEHGKGCGAIIGSVYQEKIRQGLSLSRLILFRGAVKIDEDIPTNFIYGKVDCGEFTCSRCGKIRKFRLSPEAMRYYYPQNRHGRKNRNV